MKEFNITAKALTQPNLFEEGKNKYYIQFIKGEKSFVINVGETTYNKLIEILAEENSKTIKNEKAKMDK